MSTHWFADDAAYEARLEAEVAHLRRERDRLAGVNATLQAHAAGDHTHDSPMEQPPPVQHQVQQQAQVIAPSSNSATLVSPPAAVDQSLPARVESLSVNSSEVQNGGSSGSQLATKKQSEPVAGEGSLLDAPSSPDEPLIRRRSSQAQKVGTSPPKQSAAPNRSTAKTVPKLNTKSITSEPGKLSSATQPTKSATPISAATNAASASASIARNPLAFTKIPKFSDKDSSKDAGIKRKSDVTQSEVTKRRTSASGSPPITSPAAGTGVSMESLPLPGWYIGQSVSPRDINASQLTKLVRIKDFIRELDIKQRKGESLSETFDKIRTELHDLEHTSTDAMHIKRSKLLESESLPKLFNNMSVHVPYDIIADAKALHRKWCRQDFNADPLRGIILAGTKQAGRLTSPLSDEGTGKGTRLQPSYPNRISAKFFGTGDLVSGQWWPIMLTALRDGAHGVSQGGISGKSGEGAYSVIVAGAYSDDEDNGDMIKYCGTKDQTKKGKMTEDTKLLFANIRNGHPVRVIRSGGKKENKSVYKPESGYRYDGVYDVIDSEELSKNEAHYRFTLRRQPEQDPIRFQGQYVRPSAQDQEAYRKVKDLMNGKD